MKYQFWRAISIFEPKNSALFDNLRAIFDDCRPQFSLLMNTRLIFILIFKHYLSQLKLPGYFYLFICWFIFKFLEKSIKNRFNWYRFTVFNETRVEIAQLVRLKLFSRIGTFFQRISIHLNNKIKFRVYKVNINPVINTSIRWEMLFELNSQVLAVVLSIIGTFESITSFSKSFSFRLFSRVNSFRKFFLNSVESHD